MSPSRSRLLLRVCSSSRRRGGACRQNSCLYFSLAAQKQRKQNGHSLVGLLGSSEHQTAPRASNSPRQFQHLVRYVSTAIARGEEKDPVPFSILAHKSFQIKALRTLTGPGACGSLTAPRVSGGSLDAPQGSLKKTPLNAVHREMGAKMVPFGGWDMPVEYSGLIAEHLAVRNAAGLFDVSHMGEF